MDKYCMHTNALIKKHKSQNLQVTHMEMCINLQYLYSLHFINSIRETENNASSRLCLPIIATVSYTYTVLNCHRAGVYCDTLTILKLQRMTPQIKSMDVWNAWKCEHRSSTWELKRAVTLWWRQVAGHLLLAQSSSKKKCCDWLITYNYTWKVFGVFQTLSRQMANTFNPANAYLHSLYVYLGKG